MRIVIEDAEGGIEEIKAAAVAALLEQQLAGLDLVSGSQLCGLLNITPKTLDAMGVDKIDLLGNGQVVRYSLAGVKKKLAAQTIKGVPSGTRRRQRKTRHLPAA